MALNKKISVLTLLLSLTISTSCYALFPDVISDSPLYESITFAEEHQIIQGYPDGTFRPNDLVNRAEFTKILLNYADIHPSNGENCFPEVTNEWFAQYVCTAQSKNILSGYPDGTFRPGNAINFAEVAKVAVNTLKIPYSDDDNEAEWFLPFIGTLDLRDAIPSSVTSPEQLITRGELTDILYRLHLYSENKSNNETIENNSEESSSETIPEIINLESITPAKEEYKLESNVKLSFSLLDLFIPKSRSRTTLNIGGTEYMLSVEPQIEQYVIEKIPGDEHIYKIVRTVDKQTFANYSEANCQKVSGVWENSVTCTLNGN